MRSIDSLNTRYVELKRIIDTMCLYQKKVASEQNDPNASPVAKVARSVSHLLQLSKEVDFSQNALLNDTLAIGSQYMICIAAIKSYQKAVVQSSQESADAIYAAMDSLTREQHKYDDLRLKFIKDHQYDLQSVEALNHAIAYSIKSTIEKLQRTAEQLKNEAKEIADAEYTTELRQTDPITRNDHLPTELLVARKPLQRVSQEILRDIGITSTFENIHIDMRRQGNVMVCTDFEHIEDRQLDEFIIAYILRFIENYPLGTVNVHIFDQNTNYLYKRLYNSFQSENSGEVAKRTVQLHTALSDLAFFRDVICEDIFKKTSVDTPDLYSIYESDHTDPFNLIILRDGLVDGSGYTSAEVLDTVNSLTKPGEIGHKCGLRFLIVDDSKSFEKNLTGSNRHYLSSIQQNCSTRLQYSDQTGFSVDGKPVEVLHISGNLDAFVQQRSMDLAKTINSREKSYITLDDVAASKVVPQLGNIMYIPVGKSGASVVELPLSCKDEDGTVAGQCIGYMAIGQSGSGKSSFFHSLVLNGCLKYSPRDLQFWLLDFKNGGASSKYSNCGIPHIKIIAENNKIDDALCLFQMVLEEMERRTKAFNRCFTDNIIEYNQKAIKDGLEYFPRIIIAIDEVQEIFREDNASVLQKLISSISTRMRSAGMHFVMVAQNLSEGKSYMLKDAFMPSATGRICFRVSQDIPRDSGFEDEFIQRKQEISELKTGEAYVSYGKDTIKKVKMAFISPKDMSEKVFAEIRNKYPEYSNLKPRVIGSKARLTVVSSRQGAKDTYYDVLAGLKARNGIYDIVLGEDVYRMSPFHVQFSQHENSSVLLLGSDKNMAASLCTSVAVSLMRQQIEVHLFNGDRTRTTDGYDSTPHSFMYLCQTLSTSNSMMKSHRLDQLKDVLSDVYSEYLKRQKIVQKADFEDPTFSPIAIVVNDLFGIESFISNEIIESSVTEAVAPATKPGGFNFDYDIFSDQTSSSTTEGQFREGIQNIVSTLVKNGYRYNIHVVLAIRGDPATWRTGRSVTSINNIMLFNDTEYADQIENSYYLKEMLKNISNDGDEETVAVWASRKSFSKVRPIIYRMSNKQERDALTALIKA